MNEKNYQQLIDSIQWNHQNLVPVIAQDVISKKILMFAWMNQQALQKTVETKQVYYFSRSRNQLWLKGESSGHFQKVKNIFLDCDKDVLLIEVEQIGNIACHTGRKSCFFRKWDGENWIIYE